MLWYRSLIAILSDTANFRMKPLTSVPPSDFQRLYLLPEQCTKSVSRTRDWTIPALHKLRINQGRILSVGCANGMDVLTLRAAGYEAFGTDLYPPHQDALPWFKQGSITAIPFANESFDAVTCLEVIEHIEVEMRATAVQELMRVVRKGGVVLIATPNRFFPFDEHAELVRFHSPFETETLSCSDLERLFGSPPQTIPWTGYFQFQRFGRAAQYLVPKILRIFEPRWVHRSPLNPHLFLAFTKEARNGKPSLAQDRP